MSKKFAALSPRQIEALKALEKIRDGIPAAFVNWADADSLVKLGLAERLGLGRYLLTGEGLEAIAWHAAQK